MGFMHNTMHIIILNMRQNLINKIEPADATHKVYLIIVQYYSEWSNFREIDCLCGCRRFDITLGEQHQSNICAVAVYIVVQDVRLNPMSSVTDRGWWSMHIHSIIFAVISLAFLLSGVYSSCFFRMSVMDGWVRVALLVTVAFFAVASFSYSPYDSRWLVLKCRMRFIVLNVLDNAPPREIYLEHKRQIAIFSLFLETSK